MTEPTKPPSKRETKQQNINAAYRRIFDGLNADGNLILEDLAQQARFFEAKAEIANESLQWWEGRRSIFLWLLHKGRRTVSVVQTIDTTDWAPGHDEDRL